MTVPPPPETQKNPTKPKNPGHDEKLLEIVPDDKCADVFGKLTLKMAKPYLHVPSIYLPPNKFMRTWEEQMKPLTPFLTLKRSGTDYQCPESTQLGIMPLILLTLCQTRSRLEISDNVFLKAVGNAKKELHQHDVPLEQLRNVLLYLFDPEAIFRSLSTSTNTAGFLIVTKIVLDAGETSRKERRIVIAISSQAEHWSCWKIASIYAHDDFDHLLQMTAEKLYVLYVRDKESSIYRKGIKYATDREGFKKKVKTKEDVNEKWEDYRKEAEREKREGWKIK
jgi:hypothetical protein